jgi:hypothetical protein
MSRALGDTCIKRCGSCGGWMLRAQGCGLCKDTRAPNLVHTFHNPPLRKETQ